MQNKTVGYSIILISALIGYIIYIFNQALTDIVKVSCDHGELCPMWSTINFQTNISLGIMATLIAIGLYLILQENIKQILNKKPQKINKTDLLNKAKDDNEKLILTCILDSNGTIYQSDLVEKTKLNKVKITRILDKLETRNLIERKRRGMTNLVILKHN